jgi:hypothetical protein
MVLADMLILLLVFGFLFSVSIACGYSPALDTFTESGITKLMSLLPIG